MGGPNLCERVTDPAEWPDLRSLIRVQTQRNGPRGRQRAVHYYISSLLVDAAALLAIVRGHWWVPSGRENGLHRNLNMQFREDNCRLRRGHGPAVMGIPGRVALNMVRMLQQNSGPDLSIGLLRDKVTVQVLPVWSARGLRGPAAFGGPGAGCATLGGSPPCPPRPSPSIWPSWPPPPPWSAVRWWPGC